VPDRVRDLAVWSRGAKAALTARTVSEYEGAGATWWLEDSWRVPPDEVLERVRSGPPPR
jgi:hypothetical protein